MTDVESGVLCRSTCLGVTGLPEERSVILSADKSHTIVMVGAFKYGKGHIYFNTLTNPYGRDLQRFGLNLNQWLIGKEVPGSATTEILGYTSPEVSREQVERHDLLTLRNGDTLGGTILNESFTIKTTYATLSLYNLGKLRVPLSREFYQASYGIEGPETFLLGCSRKIIAPV